MYKEIQEEQGISPNTWDTWVYRNTQGFREDLTSWKKERLVKKAEKLSEEILDLKHTSDEGKPDTRVLQVKQKESEFVRETLGGQEYSKKQDLNVNIEKRVISVDE